MAITSQFRPCPTLGDVWLLDWQAAGPLKPSAVKPVLATLEQNLVIRRLGILVLPDKTALRPAMSMILG